MKKVFYSLIVLTLATACGQDTATLKGKIADGASFPEGKLIYLLDGMEVIDSTAVTNGAFTFKVPANPQKQFVLCADYRERSPRDRSWIYPFIPEKGTFILTFGPEQESCELDGSTLNKAYKDFNQKVQDLYKEYREKVSALADDAEEEAGKLYEQTQAKVKDLSLDVIKNNPDNFLARIGLMNVIYDLELDELKEILGKCGKFIAEDNAISKIISGKEAEAATAEGKPFVDFAGKTPQGADVKLSDYVGRGKWVLADFWASWCGPCMGEIPNIKKVYEAFEGKDFMVLGIAVWDGDNSKSAAKMAEKEMKWHQIFVGEDKTPTDSYGILGIPTMILFAPDGTIHKRGEVLRGESMYTTVAEALGK